MGISEKDRAWLAHIENLAEQDDWTGEFAKDLLKIHALLQRNPYTTEDEIRRAVSS